MPVLTSEIKWQRSANFNDSAANGGRLSNSIIADDIRNNIFPNVTQAERAAGLTRYRKIFIKNINAAGEAAQQPKVFVENLTAGDDRVVLFEGTQTDVQSGITGSERLYGCGQLNQNTGTNAIEIEVEVEDPADDIFQDGDLIRISDKDDVNGTGQEEYARLYGDPSYAGNVATLTLQAPLGGQYDAIDTRVSSVIEGDDIVAAVDSVNVTSTAGTFSEGSHPITVDNRGAIEQNWTLTFTGATTFTVAGDTVGSVGSGNVGANFEPTNPGTSQPYFTIDYLAFGGTFQSGDTITFSTSPAAMPIWCKHVVPAASASQANNEAVFAIDFES